MPLAGDRGKLAFGRWGELRIERNFPILPATLNLNIILRKPCHRTNHLGFKPKANSENPLKRIMPLGLNGFPNLL
jgi:hypothetical protein